MIMVLVGSRLDPHLIRVSQELDRLGIVNQILDIETIGIASTIELQINNSQVAAGRIIGDGWEIFTKEIDLIWLRRVHLPEISTEISDANDRLFARNEWRVAIDALVNSVPYNRVINLPKNERAASKPRQLQCAAELGIRVPDTLVTSSPNALYNFLDKHQGKVIHKTLTSPPHLFAETRLLSSDDCMLLKLLPMAPVMFQEQITGIADIRITVVGTQMYAAQLPCLPEGALDSRLELNREFRIWEIESVFAMRIQQLFDKLGLVAGTVDLKLQDSGDYVFFEINPQGQFLYIEILTGLEIARGFAETFVEITSHPIH